eukprot:scaffold63143_cov36-Tisochrysis_lutea.AAC.3
MRVFGACEPSHIMLCKCVLAQDLWMGADVSEVFKYPSERAIIGRLLLWPRRDLVGTARLRGPFPQIPGVA